MRKVIMIMLIYMLFLATGCSDNSAVTETENSRPVETTKLSSETFPISLEYIGTVQSKSLKKYSFKSNGKVASLPVVNGQQVNSGDILAELDTTELTLAADAVKAQMDAAKALYDKAVKGASDEEITQARLGVKNARDSYDFALRAFEDVEKLYESGGVSKQKLDEVKLQLDSAETNLQLSEEILSQALNGSREEDKQAALAQYQQAKAGYEAQVSLVEDAQLKADVDGYVVDILYEVGELAPAGYPVVVLSTNEQIISVGVSQRDVKKIAIGNECIIDIDDTSFKGSITSIDTAIDTQSRTYNVEISIDDNFSNIDLLLGSIAKVSLIIGNDTGIWIPIPYVSNDGEDYVYIVKDERVVRKNIILKNIYQDKVLVEGLEAGDVLITKGLKNLKEGYKVTIQD